MTHTFNKSNEFMDSRIRNNRELKNNKGPTIHLDRHIINTHLRKYISVISIQLKLSYIHTTFLCISQLLTYNGNIHTRFNSLFLTIIQQFIPRDTLDFFPPTTLRYLNWIECYQLLNTYCNKYQVRQIRAQAPNLYCDLIHNKKYIPSSILHDGSASIH